MVLSNYSCFQYCDSNIKLFFIVSCKVINFNLLYFLYHFLFYWKSSAISFTFTFCYRISEREKVTTFAIAIVGRAITIWEAIYKKNPWTNVQKRLNKWRKIQYCYYKIWKFKGLIVNKKISHILGAPIIFSLSLVVRI